MLNTSLKGERLTSKSDDDLIILDLQGPLSFTFRFIYSVAVPNILLWAGLAYYSYRPEFWRALRDYVFYDGPAAAPDPITTAVITGATILFLFLAISFLLLAFVLTILAATYPWQHWFTSLTAGVLAVAVAAMPIGGALMYFL